VRRSWLVVWLVGEGGGPRPAGVQFVGGIRGVGGGDLFVLASLKGWEGALFHEKEIRRGITNGKKGGASSCLSCVPLRKTMKVGRRSRYIYR